LVTLGIDSSDDFVSVGIASQTGIVISRSSAAETRNKNVLHRFAKDTLDQAGVRLDSLNGVAVAIGPGSFTGLRVALAVAKGICWSLKLPLTGVSSLLALARCSSIVEGRIIAIKDARRSEFYYAGFLVKADTIQQSIPDSVGPAPDIIDLIGKGFKPIGPGVRELIKRAPGIQAVDGEFYDRQGLGGAVALVGRDLLADGRTLDVASAAPAYIRVLHPREWRP
jgi:tRNA threonylcarbamoyladenosine biosynthesis protein TsaB